GRDDVEARGVVIPEEQRGNRRAGEADQAEAGNRHPLARIAKGFGHHRRDSGGSDAGHRDDCVEGLHHGVRRSAFGVLGSRSGSGSGFVVLGSRFVVRSSRFVVRSSALTPPAARWMRASVRVTDGSIGRRNTFGNTPITTAMAITGTITAHSRGARSGSDAFFSLVTGP